MLISGQEWELWNDRGEKLGEWAVLILDDIEEKGGHDEISNGYFIANHKFSKDSLCRQLFLADVEEFAEDAIPNLNHFLAFLFVR